MPSAPPLHRRPTGYYPVRKGDRWVVARWLPSRNQWSMARGELFPPNYWDEVGPKSA